MRICTVENTWHDAVLLASLVYDRERGPIWINGELEGLAARNISLNIVGAIYNAFGKVAVLHGDIEEASCCRNF